MDSQPSSEASAPTRGRGRGKSRGGLGKYLRARGRGRGRGRPAQFTTRLVLEEEQEVELDEEELKELQQKYSRRQLGTNADRYVEPEPELDSDGEPIEEPEIDLSSFLEKQRLGSPGPSSRPTPPDDPEEIDASIAQALGGRPDQNVRKGHVQQIDWDESLEQLSREKAAADATRDLKSRFKANVEKERMRAPSKPTTRGKPNKSLVEAPALPTDTPPIPKTEKANLEDFLDDLLG